MGRIIYRLKWGLDRQSSAVDNDSVLPFRDASVSCNGNPDIAIVNAARPRRFGFVALDVLELRKLVVAARIGARSNLRSSIRQQQVPVLPASTLSKRDPHRA